MIRPSERFAHLARMTDDTGIIEHAYGIVPRRKEGYSTDDQARALWTCAEWLDICDNGEKPLLKRLAETYLGFMLWAQTDDGHFHNNFAYDRTKEEELPSDDCLGRCLWACAKVMVRRPALRCAFAAEEIFRKAVPRAEAMQYPRGWAYALAAFGLLAQSGLDTGGSSSLKPLAMRLAAAYRAHAVPGWQWYEHEVTYSNALLPWGMLWAYDAQREEEWLAIGLESLDFLIRLSRSEAGHIRPVGNRGWCRSGFRAQWDQQPVDVMKLALASAKAYELTRSAKYLHVARSCRDWFYGENDLGAAMVTLDDHSCFDGLQQQGPNLNCGAEAVISFLLTEAICRKVDRNS